jgi:hypothetical protein
MGNIDPKQIELKGIWDQANQHTGLKHAHDVINLYF